MNNGALVALLLGGAVIADVLANFCIKKSDGFQHRLYGILGIMLIIVCCFMMTSTMKLMDLSVTYALFGAFGLLLTTLVEIIFFKLQVNKSGVVGIISVLCGIIIIKAF